MTIEFNCPHCDKLLRTADNKAGATANCPQCAQPITVPSATPSDDWNAGDYGDQATQDDTGGQDEWTSNFGNQGSAPPGYDQGGYSNAPPYTPPPQPGYPSGAQAPPGYNDRRCPMCGTQVAATASNCPSCGEVLPVTSYPSQYQPAPPYQTAPPGPPPYGRSFMMPHRGGLILTLGILAIVFSLCCAFVGIGLGIAPWVMANNDHKAMNEGRMDPSGRGMTTAGMVCGIIGVVVGVLNMIAGIVIQLGNI